jgi:hypothetical protein
LIFKIENKKDMQIEAVIAVERILSERTNSK